MRRRAIVTAVVTLGLVGAVAAGTASEQDPPPFGGPDDVGFAADLWKAMDGYRDWQIRTDAIRGRSPHGAWVKLYSSFVTVNGRSYAAVIKDNFGGEGVSKERVDSDPGSWLGAVTIMLKRESGYDSDNQDWYWAKYLPDGSLDKNPMGMQLAGRIAKGMNQGCIACHQAAGGGDYLFTNDH